MPSDRPGGPSVGQVPPEAAAALVDGVPVDADRPERTRQASIVDAAEAAVWGTQSQHLAQAALPGVLADVPVAVLVIDQAAGTVTYANTAARELAGNVGLPVPVDAWGAAAGLADLGGSPLASSASPLSLVAAGRPVAGEAVRLSPRRSSDADRANTGADEPDQVLWVTGFPLSADASDQRLSLVVFLELDDADGAIDPEAQLQALRERAVVATDIAFTITDPRQEDDPLVWVNPSFTRISGYSYEESVGRNCRFLQGPATEQKTVDDLRQALRDEQPVTTTLLNYRKDGTAFWNQVSISPVFDGAGTLVSFVGVQTDVTERVRVEDDRQAAFAAEQAARRDAEEAHAAADAARVEAERAQSRLALMAEATSTLSATLDMDDLLERLASLCVPLLADWVFVTLVDEHGAVTGTSSAHRRGMTEELRRFAALRIADLPDAAPIRRVLRSSEPVLVPEITDEILLAAAPDPALRAVMAELGTSSQLTVPLVARRRTLGALTLVAETQARRFGPEDVDLARDLSRRAAMAMDNVRLYQQEHTVAETLQRSLLPELPEIPGVVAAAHYLSASSSADVGGDFYDLLHLPDGSVGLAVGDVVGHDVAAAAAMGHLRGLLRACAWDAGEGDPGEILGRVDRLVQGLHVAPMATMIYGRVQRPSAPGEPWRLQLANAGHPPLLLRHVDGTVEMLDGITGMLIGVDVTHRRESRAVSIPPGATLVAYTDGLIERPGEDLDQGIASLVQRLRDAPVDDDPAGLCLHAVGADPDRRDDVAVLALRFGQLH
ncbi:MULTISPECIES: PP2C family protein-serine/threonine phosphatase [unclassified Modestobacter]|uniref:PP2C family protein-serine/threonine phosphatase n=1 Tax=unclassified Modestobacter TaxID=2643866 RepID=UPI0022AAD337|nr:MULTISPECIES: SpoIIE family protein phosphatase [unclassified Modestobacter]MCZ2823071.1 SpoIIE family protein phosphatase [Modestobacter sp. VKM Ac-2981]MCZ2851317.1 SpoIIE family protein phosphatase [Modestobacter sp. VKM Ac-2982]